MVSKSQDLKDLAKIIPDQSQKLAAYGEYYKYVADEFDRLSAIGVDFRASPGLNLYELEQTLDWEEYTGRIYGKNIREEYTEHS